MGTKNQISEKNRKFIEQVLLQKSLFDASAGNAQFSRLCQYFTIVISPLELRNTLASGIINLSDLVKAYKISSRAVFDLSGLMPENEAAYWRNVYGQFKLVLQYYSEESLIDKAWEKVIDFNALFRENPQIRDAKLNLQTANLCKIADGDAQLEEELKAVVSNAVFYRSLAEIYCDLHRHRVEPNTKFSTWFRIYNSLSTRLGVPQYGFTRRDIRRMSPDAMQYCSDLLKIDLCQEKNAAKKAKMQKAAKALDYELHLRDLCEAGQNDEMLKQILYKNLCKAKPLLTAGQLKRKELEEEIFILRLCMQQTKKMLMDEPCPEKQDMLEEVLEKMLHNLFILRLEAKGHMYLREYKFC